LTLETRALAVQAAIAGMGAAVVDRNLVADLIETGVLSEIAPAEPVALADGHWFVALPERLRQRQVRQFRDWLIDELSIARPDESACSRQSAPSQAEQVSP
jgi:LysR family glycine cleavage system transcriptional activator